MPKATFFLLTFCALGFTAFAQTPQPACEQFRTPVVKPDDTVDYKGVIVHPRADVDYKGIVIDPCRQRPGLLAQLPPRSLPGIKAPSFFTLPRFNAAPSPTPQSEAKLKSTADMLKRLAPSLIPKKP